MPGPRTSASSCPARLALATGVLALATPAMASALEIAPSVTVGAVYTDNLFLTPTGQVDDLVTRIDPSIVISHASERIQLAADYTYSYLKYSETEDSDSSFSNGSADLDLALVKDAFYLESTAEISQALIDPEDGVWYTNVPIVDNRTDETRLETSPHLVTDVFGVGVDMRYVLGSISYDSDEIQDVDYQEAHTAITSREVGKGLSWGLFHDYEVYEYETPPDSKSQLAYATLTYGFRDAGDFFVFVSGGMESDYEDFTTGSLEDPYWAVGFRRLTARSLVEASVGDRSYGTAYNARIRRELNEGSIEFAYREDPSVDEQVDAQRPAVGDDPTPAPEPPSGLDRPGVGDRFVYKIASATLIKEIGRNTVEAVAFWTERDQFLVREDGIPVEDLVQDSETEVGGVLRLQRTLGRRTAVGLEGELSNREFRDGNDDQVNALRGFATYLAGAHVNLEGWVARYQQRGSDVASDNYVEYQAGLTATYNFR